MIASRHHILERYYFTLFLCFQERCDWSKKSMQMKFAMPLQQMVRSSCHRKGIVHGSTFLSTDGHCQTVWQNSCVARSLVLETRHCPGSYTAASISNERHQIIYSQAALIRNSIIRKLRNSDGFSRRFKHVFLC